MSTCRMCAGLPARPCKKARTYCLKINKKEIQKKTKKKKRKGGLLADAGDTLGGTGAWRVARRP